MSPASSSAADPLVGFPIEPLSPQEFDEVDAILDDLRTRYDETPQWEFCEGFMAALICCRRLIMPSEYLPVLLAIGDEGVQDEGSFADDAQQQRFFELWTRRWNDVAQALNAKVEDLGDEAAYFPEVVDIRGAVASLSEEARAEIGPETAPSYAQIWALGFMYAVESWPEEWAAPRDKEAAQWLDEALDAIVALTDDDTDPPTLSVYDENGAPSVSAQRLDAYASAIWAVYDLRELWRTLGPRQQTVHKAPTPGRNDPCPCGSGKKYKKCCGA
ncbi:UPF0149 family protein [Rhodoferax ferrireducens]|nr:UPF0149 family protein [Rhodoferax ferrireducens]